MLSLMFWKYAAGAVGGIALAVGLLGPLGQGVAAAPASLPLTLLALGIVGVRLRSRRGRQ